MRRGDVALRLPNNVLWKFVLLCYCTWQIKDLEHTYTNLACSRWDYVRDTVLLLLYIWKKNRKHFALVVLVESFRHILNQKLFLLCVSHCLSLYPQALWLSSLWSCTALLPVYPALPHQTLARQLTAAAKPTTSIRSAQVSFKVIYGGSAPPASIS